MRTNRSVSYRATNDKNHYRYRSGFAHLTYFFAQYVIVLVKRKIMFVTIKRGPENMFSGPLLYRTFIVNVP